MVKVSFIFSLREPRVHIVQDNAYKTKVMHITQDEFKLAVEEVKDLAVVIVSFVFDVFVAHVDFSYTHVSPK